MRQTLWEPNFRGIKFQGAKVSKNFRSWERKGRVFAPGSESSRERHGQGANGTGSKRAKERIGPGAKRLGIRHSNGNIFTRISLTPIKRLYCINERNKNENDGKKSLHGIRRNGIWQNGIQRMKREDTNERFFC